MTKLVITRGYPASGKTTFARSWVEMDPLNRLRINRDDLRHNLYGVYTGLNYAQEQFVTHVQRGAVKAALQAGSSVVVDDTNLRLKHARAWVDLAVELGFEYDVLDFYIDKEECYKRDSARREHMGERGVGVSVIEDFARRYPMPWPEVKPTEKADRSDQWEPYLPGPTWLPDAWVVDIDDTLAHNDGHRGWYDYTKVGDDSPKPAVVSTIQALHARDYPRIIVMSGRDDSCRVETERWLRKHGVPFNQLIMRATGDQRADDIVKHELFNEHVRHEFNVRGVFDDRPQVCRMWRAIGLDVFQVGDPHIEF